MARMVNGGFHFVPVDDPQGRQSKKCPESQRYTKEARKHVMKDIGFSRRKDKEGKASRFKRIELEVVDGGEGPASCGGDEAQLVHSPVALQHIYEEGNAAIDLWCDGAEDDQKEDGGWVLTTTTGPISPGHNLPSLAKSLGSGRIDPFVKYPVELGHRPRYLLDTRKSTYLMITNLMSKIYMTARLSPIGAALPFLKVRARLLSVQAA